MKKKNSCLEFGTERNLFLLQQFRKSIAKQSHISLQKAFKEAADSPAPRFWVSEDRATEVISKMLQGQDPTPDMLPERARMYREICRRVRSLKRSRPDEPLCRLVFSVVNSPAPASYLSPNRIKTIVYETKRKSK